MVNGLPPHAALCSVSIYGREMTPHRAPLFLSHRAFAHREPARASALALLSHVAAAYKTKQSRGEEDKSAVGRNWRNVPNTAETH